MLKSPTKTAGGSVALLAACRAGDLYTVENLVVHATSSVAKAATPGDIRRIALTINASEPSGWTPILYAARHGWSHIAEQLLAATAHIPVHNTRLHSSGNTALHIAAMHGHLEVVRLLLRALQEQQQQLRTPRTSQTLSSISPLTSPKAKTQSQYSQYSSRSSATDTAAAAAGDVTSPAPLTSPGRTFSGLTVFEPNGQQQQQQLLSPRTAASRIPAAPGPETGLSPTAGSGAKSSSSSSFVVGVDVRNSNGDTPLMFAMSSGHMGVAAALLAAGGSAAAANAVGITPLLAAAGHGQAGCVLLLKRTSGDDIWQQLVAARDAHARTALHFAAASGHIGVVHQLLTPPHPADVWATSDLGRTALQEAQQAKHKECARLIQEQMQEAAAAADAAAAALLQEEQPAAAAGQQQQHLLSRRGRSTALHVSTGVNGLLSPTKQQQQQQQRRISRSTDALLSPRLAAAAAAAGGSLSPRQQQYREPRTSDALLSPTNGGAAAAAAVGGSLPTPTNTQQQQQQQQVPAALNRPVSPAAAARAASPSRIPGPPAVDRSGPAATAVAAGSTGQGESGLQQDPAAVSVPGASSPTAINSSSSSKVSNGKGMQAAIDADTNGWTAVVTGRKGRKSSNSGSSAHTAAAVSIPGAATAAAKEALARLQDATARTTAAGTDAAQNGADDGGIAAAAAGSSGSRSSATPTVTYSSILMQQQQQREDPAATQSAAAAAPPGWWDNALSQMHAAVPAAAALDIQPQHVLGLDVDQLSVSQLECLELIHRAALARISDARIQLANQQHVQEEQEQQKIKQEIAHLVERVKLYRS